MGILTSGLAGGGGSSGGGGGASGMTLLSTTDLSAMTDSSPVDIELAGNYAVYKVIIAGFASDDVVYMRLGTDASTFATAGGSYRQQGSSSTSAITNALTNASGYTLSAEIDVYDPHDSAQFTSLITKSMYGNGSNAASGLSYNLGTASRTTAQDNTHIRFYLRGISPPNSASAGVAYLYGIGNQDA